MRADTEEGRLGGFARIDSLRSPKSALWLQTLPTEPGLTLTDCKWQWSAWLRLGMVLHPIGTGCGACKQPDAYIDSSWHPLHCVPLSGPAITDGHNDVLHALGHFCRLSHLNVRLEPASLDHDTHKRPDIQVSLPDKILLGDVTITHPATKSWRKKVARHGAAAVGDLRERQKNRLYSAIAADQDMDFLPLVFYTYGDFHSSAIKFIKRSTH
jgi:hypothetical protein